MPESDPAVTENKRNERAALSPSMRRGALVVWATYSVALLAMSLVPGHSVPTAALLGWDKLAHAVAFLALGLLTAATMVGHRPWVIPTVAYGGIMGLLSEGIQSFTPGRDSSVPDMFANAVGVTAAILVAMALTRFAMSRRTASSHSEPE